MAEAALAAEGRVSVKVDRMAAGSSRTSRRIDSLDMFLLYAMSRAPLPRAKLLRGSEQVECPRVLLDRRRDTIYNPPVRVTHHRRQVLIEPGAALDHLRLRPHVTGTRGHKPPLAFGAQLIELFRLIGVLPPLSLSGPRNEASNEEPRAQQV